MDNEIIYALIGTIALVFIIIYVVKSANSKPLTNSKHTTKEEILNRYEQELSEALEPLKNDKERRVAKKNELLQKISKELSMNIFFDKNELRDIIVDFSKKY
jgi:uncharacterized protein YpuA (DUF1002 family)